MIPPITNPNTEQRHENNKKQRFMVTVGGNPVGGLLKPATVSVIQPVARASL